MRAIGDDADAKTIENWERYDHIDDGKSLNLVELFNNYLFKTRRWINGETGLTKRNNSNTSVLVFNEHFIDDFKGVNLNEFSYPYSGIYTMLKENHLEFPSSLCMPIIDGDAFFKYIEYSYELINRLFYDANISNQFLKEYGSKCVSSRDYRLTKVVNLYENMLALFIDRFGEKHLTDEVCERIFIWAFYPRAMASRILDSTQANYAAGGKFQGKSVQKLFQVLNSATTPNDFMSQIEMNNLQNYNYEDIIERLKEKGW